MIYGKRVVGVHSCGIYHTCRFYSQYFGCTKKLICRGMKIRCLHISSTNGCEQKNVRKKICKMPNKLYPSFCGFIDYTDDDRWLSIISKERTNRKGNFGWFLIFTKDLRFRFFIKKNFEWFWFWFWFRNQKKYWEPSVRFWSGS
jgi:hypothetical protein